MFFLFRANHFEGRLVSSEEGKMHWILKEELNEVNLVEYFDELLKVMLNDSFNEFQYVVEDGQWIPVLK